MPSERLYVPNIDRKRIRLYHSDLPKVRDDVYRRKCPFCLDGMLLLSRGEDGRLVPNDMCIGCGQRVEYLDIKEIEGTSDGS